MLKIFDQKLIGICNKNASSDCIRDIQECILLENTFFFAEKKAISKISFAHKGGGSVSEKLER